MSKILIIDRHAQSCEAFVRLLRLCGETGVCATDADEAFPVLEQAEVKLILLDVTNPQRGFDLLKSIRLGPGLQSLPVVTYSALQTPEIAAESLRHGAQAFVPMSEVSVYKLRNVISTYCSPKTG